MDPPERQAQSPTLGVRVDGDIAGSRNQGALVPGTAATEGGASPARESFAASGASPSREAMTSFGVGQSKGESGSITFPPQQQLRSIVVHIAVWSLIGAAPCYQ